MKKNFLTQDFLSRVEKLKKEAQRRADEWALDKNKKQNIYYNVIVAEMQRIEREVRFNKLPPKSERCIVTENEIIYNLPKMDSFSVALLEVLKMYRVL